MKAVKDTYISEHLVKYLAIGIVNTIVGYSVIFSLMFFGVRPDISNACGYAVGIIVSFILNKRYNFRSYGKSYQEFFKFVVSMFAAYLMNLATLLICWKQLKVNPYASQIIAGGAYVLTGYTLSKVWVFRN